MNNLAENLEFQKNIPLSFLTTWKIGGQAKFFTAVKSVEELHASLKKAKDQDLPVFILGGGSNLLVSDGGFDGLVIKIEFLGVEVTPDGLTAGAGEPMSKLAAISLQNNFSGLEWAVGIPGTVGGAVFGNSNCFGGSTGHSLTKATLLTLDGEIKSVSQDYFDFSYDYSILQKSQEIVLDATFGLTKHNPEEIKKIRDTISKTAADRVRAQPLGKKVAGSVFKAHKLTPMLKQKLDQAYPEWRKIGLRDNLVSSGFIIDKLLGLKGKQMGQMKISEVHANFFENLGNATAMEAKNLIDFVKKECINKLGIELEEEIRYVGDF